MYMCMYVFYKRRACTIENVEACESLYIYILRRDDIFHVSDKVIFVIQIHLSTVLTDRGQSNLMVV